MVIDGTKGIIGNATNTAHTDNQEDIKLTRNLLRRSNIYSKLVRNIVS